MHLILEVLLMGGTFMDSAAFGEASSPSGELILSDVTIVDTHDGKLTPGATIVIEDGKITKIVRSGKIDAAANALHIDGQGRFAVPGF